MAKSNTPNADIIMDLYPEHEFMFADGFDSAIIGVAERCGSELLICYDRQKVIAGLVTQGMSEEEAIEYYEFNIVGGYMGPKTPMFIDII